MRTQTERLLHFLTVSPGASSLEIVQTCGIINTTGRISDLRAAGHDIVCKRRASDGQLGYWIVKHPVQLTLTGEEVPVAV
jgi:hypothetical protein